MTMSVADSYEFPSEHTPQHVWDGLMPPEPDGMPQQVANPSPERRFELPLGQLIEAAQDAHPLPVPELNGVEFPIASRTTRIGRQVSMVAAFGRERPVPGRPNAEPFIETVGVHYLHFTVPRRLPFRRRPGERPIKVEIDTSTTYNFGRQQ